jgi:hypothetical protein
LRTLKSHLVRDKVTENLHITERAFLPTLLNRLAAVRLKIQQERLEEFLVKQVTRVVSVSGRVAKALDGVDVDNVDPLDVLRRIASDESAPASARVSACKELRRAAIAAKADAWNQKMGL